MNILMNLVRDERNMPKATVANQLCDAQLKMNSAGSGLDLER
jgi:hypothetical protein